MSASQDTRHNPSRKECERIIRKLLITDILENGRNTHFRMATDFLKYFESLYPASDSLTKQIQRAVKAMDMPKDENGYYIVDKTTKQAELENRLKTVFSESMSVVTDLDGYTPISVTLKPETIDYAVNLIERIDPISINAAVIVKTDKGIIIYTKNKEKLIMQLNNLIQYE